jgi:restriction endonuclease S subunit
MSDVWIQTTIRDISDFVSTRHLPSRLNPETPYVGLEHIEPRSPRIDDWGSVEGVASQVTPFEPEDVLFGRLRPYLHKVVSADFSGVCSPEVLVLRANHRCLPKFLYLICSAEATVRACVSMSAGTRMPRTSTTDLASIALQLPSLEEQKRIVNLVSAVDEYIAALQRQADAARTARNAVLHELLTAGGDEWVETTLGDLCELYQPETIAKSEMDDTAPYVVYGANGPVGRYFRFNHEEPQVVVTCRGATCGVVNLTPPNCWITGNAMVVKPRDNRSTREFLFLALQSSVDLKATISGSAQPQITRVGLAPSKIKMPPPEVQSRIVEVVSSMNDVIREIENAIVESKNLRSGLLSDLLSGEHEIPASYDRLLGVA